MPLPSHIPASKAAKLLATSASSISHDIERGKFKDVRRVKGRTDIALSEVVERLGRPLTDDERRLLEQPAYARQATPTVLSDADILARIDPGTASFFGELRDRNWLAHLHRLGIGPVQAPPLSEFVTPVLDHQRFFTRAQAEELLAAALTQRDAAWQEWRNSDLVHQAQNPDGPQPLAVKDINL
jgi:hypothetical protein